MTSHDLNDPSLFTRRTFLAGLAAFGAGNVAQAQQVCTDRDAPLSPGRRDAPLGALNKRARWGVAIGAPAIDDNRLLDALQTERPKHLAMANALKFDFLHGKQPALGARLAATTSWSECDAIVALATRWGIPVRGDALAWNDWQAEWLKTLVANGGQAQARDYFRQHFEGVFDHFAALALPDGAPMLQACGLVNEPFDPWNPRAGRAGRVGWRDGAWIGAFGMAGDGVPGYIHAAFELADRYARPATKLFLNETNCDNDKFGPMTRAAMLDLVDKLQRAGRRIDAVGLECHLMPQWMTNPAAPDWRPFVAFLNELGRRGLEVYLTELDVNDCSLREARDRDQLVADTVRGFIGAALESPAVTMVTTWDLSDRYSWYRDEAVFRSLPKWADCVYSPPCPRPAPYDAQMRPKRARDALADALSNRP